MSSHLMEHNGPAPALEHTFESTFDPAEEGEERDEAVSYLVPRLAAYAVPSLSSSASRSSLHSDEDGVTMDDNDAIAAQGDADAEAEEDRLAQVSQARESGERSAARAAEDELQEGSRGQTKGVSVWDNEEVAVGEARESAEEGADGLENAHVAAEIRAPHVVDTEDVEEVEEAFGGSDEDDDVHHVDSDDDARDTRLTSNTYANAFAHSRVKELLKFEGSSSIVSKDAAAAACEAVALLTRDLVAMAAAEATRKNRKTLTYDDVARVAQLLDRFSFLADVVPPVPSSSGSGLGAGKSIVVGSHVRASGPSGGHESTRGRRATATDTFGRSKSSQVRARGHTAASSAAHKDGGAAVRSKTTHARSVSGILPHSVHPQPGGMRQATLRF